MKPGIKYDNDKPKMELLPFLALNEVAKVLSFGAKKYGKDNWKSLKDAEDRYTGALLRHLGKIQEGEVIDTESKLPHIAHVACNALFLTYFYIKEKLKKESK